MPTRRKPQLNHNSPKYSEIFERLHHELLSKEKLILELVGFSKEFGDVSNPAGAELISEIAGLLATSATIRLDAGYKAPRKVIATLEAISKNPRLALCDGTEPEARGALAIAYQRSSEPPGTYGFDIYRENGVEPDENQIHTLSRPSERNSRRAFPGLIEPPGAAA